ncbi:MAG: MFS transporter [Bacteroidales bacterium]|nr:MFS transporter [Bacteroidales bacterium]MBN2817604.1 MFS transporter [Bacteroidales bacterium]
MMTASKIRLIYLLMYMAFAVWRVYYNIYLEDIGLRGSQIGTLNALMQAALLPFVIFWGAMADKKGIRPVLRWLVIATAIIIVFLGKITSFWYLLFYIPFLTLFYHPLGPLTDAMAVQFTETSNKHAYGGFRLWGSMGWMIASILGGIVFSRIDLKYIFPVSSGLFVLLLFLLFTRKRKRIFKPNYQSISFKEIIKDKQLLYFILLMIAYGITCSPVNSYINLYFRDINAGNDIVGYAYAVMAFSELPLFLLGDKLLKKWGPERVIIIAMIAMLIRFMFYGLVPNIGLALIVGAVQGISLSFFLVGAVGFMQNIMAEGRHATAQSLIWGTMFGIGQMIGNLFIGSLLDSTGMVGIMKIFIIISFACLVFGLFYFKIYNIKKPLA